MYHSTLATALCATDIHNSIFFMEVAKRIGSITNGRVFMDLSTIWIGAFVALISMVAMYRIYRMRTVRMQVASYRSQTMCPSCGSITARYKVSCLHCGKPLRSA